jgi:hypothetical protein
MQHHEHEPDMSLQSFQFFFAEACSQLGVDVSTIQEGDPIAVGETLVYVDYAEPADLCRLVVDLGPLPAERRAELLQVMLEVNCVDAADILPVFSLHPVTSRAVLSLFVPLAGLDSQRHRLALLLGERVPELVEGWAQLLEQGPPPLPVEGESVSHAGAELKEGIALFSRRV